MIVLIIIAVVSVLLIYPCFIEASAVDRNEEKLQKNIKKIPEKLYWYKECIHKITYK